MKTASNISRPFLIPLILILFIIPSLVTAQELIFWVHGWDPGHNNMGERLIGMGDQNGDGFDDIAITGDSNGEPSWVLIFYGGNPMDTIPDFELSDTLQYMWFVYADNIGDILPDGNDDIAITQGISTTENKLLIYELGLNPNNEPDFILNSSAFANTQIKEKTGVGDVNGDGYDDFLVSATDEDTLKGKVCIFFGGDILDTIPDWSLHGTEHQEFLGKLPDGGVDLNGDGFDDFMIFHFIDQPYSYEYLVFFGGDPIDTIPDLTLNHLQAWMVEDFNGDSFGDIIASYNGDSTAIYLGGENMDNIPDLWLYQPDGVGFPNKSDAGDVNNDGYSDIIQGECSGLGFGAAIVHFGSWDMDGDWDIFLWGATNFQAAGVIGRCGDVNGDGADDIITGTDRIYGVKIYAGDSAWAVSVKEPPDEPIPADFTEIKAYPNPFNSTVQLEIILKGGDDVDVSIYDLTGRLVKSLYSSSSSSGEVLNLTWDGVDEDGFSISSGIYFVSVKGENVSLTKKIVMVY